MKVNKIMDPNSPLQIIDEARSPELAKSFRNYNDYVRVLMPGYLSFFISSERTTFVTAVHIGYGMKLL